jgi:UPF0042 nucleotide-binding protein
VKNGDKRNNVAKFSHLILVTGLSGAGGSTALKFLEDLGFYYLDHLPVDFLLGVFDQLRHADDRFDRLAVGIHIPNREQVPVLRTLYAGLPALADRHDVLYLEASADQLVQRYRETRRRHPLAQSITVREAVDKEAQFMAEARAMADLVIDTTHLPVPLLKERLNALVEVERRNDLVVFIRSFGFKYGANTDADMVLDGRFLANPYYDPALRPLSGQDGPVRDFLERDGEALVFLEHLERLFDYLIPRYQREKKRYFTLDIGCTGGRHRSVFLVEALAAQIGKRGFRVHIRHRDKDREAGRRGVDK